MRAKLLQHAMGIRIWVATGEAEQMDTLRANGVDNLAGHVVSAFNQVDDDHEIADPLAAIGSQIAIDRWRDVSGLAHLN
jgi:hypothetical protein